MSYFDHLLIIKDHKITTKLYDKRLFFGFPFTIHRYPHVDGNIYHDDSHMASTLLNCFTLQRPAAIMKTSWLDINSLSVHSSPSKSHTKCCVRNSNNFTAPITLTSKLQTCHYTTHMRSYRSCNQLYHLFNIFIYSFLSLLKYFLHFLLISLFFFLSLLFKTFLVSSSCFCFSQSL